MSFLTNRIRAGQTHNGKRTQSGSIWISVCLGVLFTLVSSMQTALAQLPTLPAASTVCDYTTEPANISLTAQNVPAGYNTIYLLVNMTSGMIVQTNATVPVFSSVPRGLYYAVPAHYKGTLSNAQSGKLISDVYSSDLCLTYGAPLVLNVCNPNCDYVAAPASVTFTAQSVPAGVSTRYVLVDMATNLISQVSNTPSFPGVTKGEYAITSIHYTGSLTALAAGNSLYGVTTENENCRSVSNTIYVNVCNSPIAITGPVDGTTVASTNPPISGTATPGSSVTVTGGPGTTGGPCVTTADANGNWSCTSLTFPVGSQTVTAVASSVGGTSTTATTSFTVIASPQPPVVTPDIANTSPGKPVSGNVLTNDSDPDGGTLIASVTTQPLAGTVTMSPTGSYTYTPPTGFTGVVTFCYTATNTAGLSASTCVTINVNPDPSLVANNAPIANNDNTQTTAGTNVTINVAANDTDPDSATTLNGQLNTPTIVSQPTAGTASVVNGAMVYTPPTGFTGVVSFPYSICDKATPALCATAVVTVNVLPTPQPGTILSPVAMDDALLTTKNTSATGTVAANDSDPNSPASSLTFASGQPTHGTVIMAGNGSYAYIPATNYTGPDSFTYSACNSAGKCDVATVSINVQVPANGPPVLVGEPIVTEQNKPLTVCLPIVDGDVSDTHSVSLCGQPSQGTLTASVNNTTQQVCLTYTPAPAFTGSTSACLTVCDAAGACTTLLVPITVSPASQTVALPQPPVVVVVPVVTARDSTAQVCMTIADPNLGDVQSVSVCSSPAQGSVTATVNNSTHQVCVTYTPTGGSVGPDAICLLVCDQTGLCTQVTVPVTIVDPTPPGTTPVAPLVTPTPIVVTVGQTVTVCTGITDNAGDTQTATLCGQPASGVAQVAVNNTTHALCVTYTAGNVPASTTVCVQVCDQTGQCTTLILPITVLPAPKALLLPKVWLQGALFGVSAPTGLMRDDLRVKKYLPATSPYSSWNALTTVGPVSNTALVFGVTGSEAIVDWVFVELRSPANYSLVVDSRPALVQRDGDIVEIDGVSPVAFNAVQGSYYVSVKHRNHLGVMTASALPLSVTGTSVDFRSPATATYRVTTSALNQSQVTVAQGVALWGGNVVYDKSVIYQGTTNDVSAIANQVKGPLNLTGATNFILNGYYTGDVNLDGRTIYQGNSNDVNYIYLNVTKNHPGNPTVQNFFVIREQLP